MTSHLIVDSDFLCHRIFHSSNWHHDFAYLPEVFLRDVELLIARFNPDRVSLCFDSRQSLRKEEYPRYKSGRNRQRKEATKAEKKAWKHFCLERIALRKVLKEYGFRNVFIQQGYEADDMIASVIEHNVRDGDFATIVTSDHDLFQLLSTNVQIYLLGKKKMYTISDFRSEWGLEPSQWVDVKSIAGCSSDDIEGIRGIGERTAAAFLQGKLKSSSRKYLNIVTASERWKRNRTLVQLPYAGCPRLRVRKELDWKFRKPIKGVRKRGKRKE